MKLPAANCRPALAEFDDDAAFKKFGKVIRDYPDSPAASEATFNSGTVFYERRSFKRAMALSGNTYQDILDFYYQGIRIMELSIL